jgi:hypothetical protein
MTENQIPAPSAELDFDAWLAGGERAAHYVNLYSRLDLIASIEELQKQLVAIDEVTEGDEAMGGNEDPNEDLHEQVNALYAEVDASKREFRVEALTDEESDEIQKQVRTDLSDQIDAAATEGQTEARKTAKRLGITAPGDINNLVRVGANETATALVNREAALRKIAQATKVRQGGDWLPLTVGQVRALYKKLGQAQIDMLADAAMKAANEVPEVTIPKS